jgi:hypothetical protein
LDPGSGKGQNQDPQHWLEEDKQGGSHPPSIPTLIPLPPSLPPPSFPHSFPGSKKKLHLWRAWAVVRLRLVRSAAPLLDRAGAEMWMVKQKTKMNYFVKLRTAVVPTLTSKKKQSESTSVADPDPGSGIRCLFDPWIRDPEWVCSGSRIPDPKTIF